MRPRKTTEPTPHHLRDSIRAEVDVKPNLSGNDCHGGTSPLYIGSGVAGRLRPASPAPASPGGLLELLDVFRRNSDVFELDVFSEAIAKLLSGARKELNFDAVPRLGLFLARPHCAHFVVGLGGLVVPAKPGVYGGERSFRAGWLRGQRQQPKIGGQPRILVLKPNVGDVFAAK